MLDTVQLSCLTLHNIQKDFLQIIGYNLLGASLEYFFSFSHHLCTVENVWRTVATLKGVFSALCCAFSTLNWKSLLNKTLFFSLDSLLIGSVWVWWILLLILMTQFFFFLGQKITFWCLKRKMVHLVSASVFFD